MPKNMSFALTLEQIQNQTKTVTRRKGWGYLKPGDILNACRKCMGFKKGEKVEVIAQIRVVSVRREPLDAITIEEVRREGFPGWTPNQFIRLYCQANQGPADQPTTRIEFEYL